MSLLNDVIRVLHIEDSDDDVALIRATLERSEISYDLTVANTLAEGLALAAVEEFDVVLLDLNLPDSDAGETVTSFTQKFPSVPVVVCSNQTSPETALTTIAQAAHDFWPKWQPSQQRSRLDEAIMHAIARNEWMGELAAAERRVREVMNSADVGLIVVLSDASVAFMNEGARGLLAGVSDEEERPPIEIPDPGDTERQQLWDGRWLSVSASSIAWEGEPATLATVLDVTSSVEADSEMLRITDSLQAANAELHRLVLLDPLTGVSNRRGFDRALSDGLAAARRHGWSVSAALIDCDDFKAVNEAFGHDGGDEVLRAIARRASAALRATDHLARIGGDEFLALLPNASIWQASRVCERVRLRVAATPLEVRDGDGVSVSVSIGVAQVDLATDTLDSVIAACRSALAASKRAGKDTVRVHGATESASEVLRGALVESSTFEAWSRPVGSLTGESRFASEVQCRSTVPDFEKPADFYALARDLHVWSDVDLTCTRTAIEHARKTAVGPVFLHAYGSTLARHSSLTDDIARLLSRLPAVGVFLHDEPRTVVGEDVAGAIARLRSYGVWIGLAGLGCGTTPLTVLSTLAPDIVRFDERVLRRARNSGAESTRARRLVRMCRAAGAEVIVRGVSDPADIDIVRNWGADWFQGPHLDASTGPGHV